MTTFLSSALAASGTTINVAGGINSNLNFSVNNIVSWAVTVVIVVAGLIFFFMLIIGGVRWILSGGDKGSTESARGQITAALIGLVIVFSAWAIAQLVQSVFGVDILNVNIPGIKSN